MFPLPALPFVPKLHSFFEPEQSKTFMLIFGVALLAQWFLPWSGSKMSWDFFGVTLWPLLTGVGFTVLSFVPGLKDQLKPNLLFIITAGVGTLGVLWSFAGAGNPMFVVATPSFWFSGLGLLGLATMTTGLFLWARNGYKQLYWVLVLSGLIGLGLGLLVPIGGELPLLLIFKMVGGMGLGFSGVLFGVGGLILSLAFIGLIVLLVINVFLKKEDADVAEVGRFGSVFFLAAMLFPVAQGLLGLPFLSAVLHSVVTTGIFLWLTIWGLVCFFEAKERGENLFSL